MRGIASERLERKGHGGPMPIALYPAASTTNEANRTQQPATLTKSVFARR